MDSPMRVNVQSYVPGGKRSLGSKFGLTKEQIDKFIQQSLRDSCRLVRDYAKRHHRYEDNPARQQREGFIGLTRAIHFHILDKAKKSTTRAGERYTGEVYVDEKEAPYAKYQITETKSLIKPIRASRLKFFSDRYGRWYSLMQVKGRPKDDFIRNAYKNNRAEIKAIFAEGLRRLING